MHNISWEDYRHPKFLQSLNLTLNELKFLNLFLKKTHFGIDTKQEDLHNSILVSPRRSLNPSKLITQEEVAIKI